MQAPFEKITILITDDHALVRQSLGLMLNAEPRFKVIAECESGEAAVEKAKEVRPDVVLMDYNLPGMNGIEATQLIRKYSPGSKVLGVSLHNHPVYARKMVQSGAMGYLTKNSSHEEMVKAITDVYNNKKYICDEIKTALSEKMMGGEETTDRLSLLSKRELDIIAYVKQGMSSREIAETISISIKTVEVHRYNILKKLNLKNVAALVNYINNSSAAI